MKPRPTCACKHNDREWLRLCELHAAEEKELHERAGLEYQAGKREREIAADELMQ